MEELICTACDYEWMPRVKTGLPKQCPRCKRYGKIEIKPQSD